MAHLPVKPPPRFTRPLLAMLVVVLLGTAGFGWIEGWPPLKALFFTLITVTTVGYSDYGLSPAGERFSMLILVGGIAVVTYAGGSFVREITDAEANRRRRTRKRIEKMNNHYIVCGYGAIGQNVCLELGAQGAEVLIIERDRNLGIELQQYGLPVLIGDAIEDPNLVEAGIEKAKGIVAATASDAVNLTITLAASELNPDLYIVARAEHERGIRRLRRAGAHTVVSPDLTGAHQIAQTVAHPSLADSFDGIRKTGPHLAEIEVKPGSALAGRSIGELSTRYSELVIVSHTPPGEEEHIRPDADTRVRDGDTITVAGCVTELETIAEASVTPARAAA